MASSPQGLYERNLEGLQYDRIISICPYHCSANTCEKKTDYVIDVAYESSVNTKTRVTIYISILLVEFINLRPTWTSWMVMRLSNWKS